MHQTSPLQKEKPLLSEEELIGLRSRDEVLDLLVKKGIDPEPHLYYWKYLDELKLLQIELIKLQNWISKTGKRVAIIFEGRDAAGKGGSIRRFTQHLSPRSMRVVALSKPSFIEKGQWYFRRYVKELPNPGEIVFFDRSWYNRAVVEPVMGFCTKEEYELFMQQVPEFEHMLTEDGVIIIKLWFSITKEEQEARFMKRKMNKLKQWKLSPVDEKSQDMWDKFTHYKRQMFSRTHTTFTPWHLVKTNDKKVARLESIRHVLSRFEYEGKDDKAVNLYPDPNVIIRFHRSIFSNG